MSDHKFHDASFTLKPIWHAEKQLKHEEIKRVSKQFATNIARSRCIMDFIHAMTHFATMYERSAHQAMFNLTGHVRLTAAEQADAILRADLQKELHRLCDEETANATTHPSSALRDEERTRNNLKFLMQLYSGPILEEGIQRVFQSMITGTWTAFEVMAGDLWETALNIHPLHLASLANAEGKVEKTIELNYLERNGYDLSKMMGTVHKDAGRFKFQVLTGGKNRDGIREAFLAAFRKDGDAVKTAISNESLDALSLMRNVLVHSAGKTDKKFLDGSRPLAALAKWNSSEIDSPIELDGGDVSALLNPVVCCSMDLIQAVDNWLTTHP